MRPKARYGAEVQIRSTLEHLRGGQIGGVSWRETFGLTDLSKAFKDGLRTGVGVENRPRTQWGPSSARIFKPSIGFPTWLGQKRSDRRVPIYNYFNRIPQPRDEGYSVRVTYARDYRGGRFTYDGHLGTDFAVPVGTPIVAAAPGVVLWVGNDMARGGLKVCIDHGDGLFTTSNHLCRSFVQVGQKVRRAQVIALSGASGIEFVLFFPWVSPHLHFNVWLNGEPTDPFARPGEASLWRTTDPTPAPEHEPQDAHRFTPSDWDPAGIEAYIDICKDPQIQAHLRALPSLPAKGAEILLLRNYYATLFDQLPPVYTERAPRAPRLDLPFSRDDFAGIVHGPR